MKPVKANQLQRNDVSIGIGHGCLFALVSTLVTCLLLFINGGLVAALRAAAAEQWPVILGNPDVAQCVLFVGPVLLVIVEWTMIDYVISRVRRWP